MTFKTLKEPKIFSISGLSLWVEVAKQDGKHLLVTIRGTFIKVNGYLSVSLRFPLQKVCPDPWTLSQDADVHYCCALLWATLSSPRITGATVKESKWTIAKQSVQSIHTKKSYESVFTTWKKIRNWARNEDGSSWFHFSFNVNFPINNFNSTINN